MQADSRLSLNEKDQTTRDRIVQQLDKNFLIEAAAGTGKTTCMVGRMVQLIEQGVCDVEKLVAVTFTRKAASELRDRFQSALRQRASVLQAENMITKDEALRKRVERLEYGATYAQQAAVGTIHSFCARMLRERPIEFDVDPAFRELDEAEDEELRKQAWVQNTNDLLAQKSPLIDQLEELGINRELLEKCFERFLAHRDIETWPAELPEGIDLDQLKRSTQEYIEEMKSLLDVFPPLGDRGTDKMMERYEQIVRASDKDWSRDSVFFQLLERFDHSDGCTQKNWHDKKVAKQNKTRWLEFRKSHAAPGIQYWSRLRYQFVLKFLQRAVSVYEKLRQGSGGLGFDDLLWKAAKGLQSQPVLRRYFAERFTHILVDEFQDTDPVQAELLMYLAADDPEESDWTRCQPRPGALFLVGDPKQSIYRFRRGDIVTYSRVAEIFSKTGGDILPLVKNFRSSAALINWNNSVYRHLFPEKSTPQAPAARDMLPINAGDSPVDAAGEANENAEANWLSGVHRLQLPEEGIHSRTAYEADSIARLIRSAIDQGLHVRRANGESEQSTTSPVEPRDFLVIPHGKQRMSLFREALQRYQIPCEVSGDKTFQGLPELQILLDVLRTIEDPQNPVHLLAIMRHSVFGFSDQEIFSLRSAGGRFHFASEVPGGLDSQLKWRYQSAWQQLQNYQRWIFELPFSSSIARIADDLGLIAQATTGSEGNESAGALLKAIEIVRQHSASFDSTSDAITCLEALLDSDESSGCSALPPDGNVVRVMNLHKAKGLEAPIVFLADTSGWWNRKVLCHLDRTQAEPQGFIGITEEKKDPQNKFRNKVVEVATPANWADYQNVEAEFLAAEMNRLLYVATTRAENCLVVSVGDSKSRWGPLYSHLDTCPELEVPTHIAEVKPQTNEHDKPLGEEFEIHLPRFSQQWTKASQPTYVVEAAKKLGLRGVTRPDWEASGDYGHQWGSAMHDLLELAVRSPETELEASALVLANEHGLGAGRVDELLATVESVRESELWERAQSSKRCLVEVPIDVREKGAEVPTFVRGVIDLLFQEEQGWVLVDYKTDDIRVSQVLAAREFYRGQLDAYAKYWEQVTGEMIAEKGLYFTRIQNYQVL